MSRKFWIVFGASVQLLFLVTVWRLYPFLEQGGRFRGLLAPSVGSGWTWCVIDGLLAAQFGVAHSTLLLPQVRKALVGWIPSALYGCFFCLTTCLSQLLVIEAWQPSPGAVWHLQNDALVAVAGAFLASWVGLFYSLSLNGFGYQTGWTPWWAFVRGREEPRREFKPRGAYRVLRHPVYLCFLGLIWFNPEMTLDRLLLALSWTVYVYIGSDLKDRRLVRYLGGTYRDYQAQVPGYPFIPWGPLARHRAPRGEVDVNVVADMIESRG